MKTHKECTICKNVKPLSDFGFYAHKNGKQYPNSRCIDCGRKYALDLYHEKNPIKYTDKPECSVYFGVHIAERVLSYYFNDVERMKYGNVGFDFICNKGFKIDSKSACRYKPKDKKADRWKFSIEKNMTADYFLCIAFDSRESLNPEHLWLIPGNIVNTKNSISIYDSKNSLKAWEEYEKPIDKVISCCNSLKQ